MDQAKKALGKREIGLIAGILVALVIYLLPLQGLPAGGKITLALTLMVVIWWATGITHPAYSSGIFIVALILFGAVPGTPATEAVTDAAGKILVPAAKAVTSAQATAGALFGVWRQSSLWLIIGATLIAAAVSGSGLGERIAYNYTLRFVKSFKSIIIGVFVLTFLLGFLIPQPWARAFLLIAVMNVVAQSSGIAKEDTVKIGLAVFAASVPVSLITLTGDAGLNAFVGLMTNTAISYTDWLVNMGVPATIMSVLTLVLCLVLFKPTREVEINKDEIRAKVDAMGKMSGKEVRTTIWLVIAIVLWVTNGIHHIDVGWITMAVGLGMALPIVGNILGPKDIAGVPIGTLIFATAAIGIGAVGGASGMNAWIAKTVLPAAAPSDILMLALMITAIAFVLHMVLGSAVAVLGIVVPAMLAFTAPMGINPVAIAFLVYMVIASHYILPFHHMNMLVGADEKTGGYTSKETLRLGIPLTAAMFLVGVVVMFPWMQLTGFLK